MQSVEEHTFVAPTRLDFRTFIEERWLPATKATIRPSTWDSYRRNLELHVLSKIGGLPLQAITPGHLNAIYSDLLESGHQNVKGRGLTHKTVRNVHVAVHKAFQDAVRWSLIHHNPADNANPPRVRASGNAGIRTWTEHELATFLDSVKDDRLYALWRTAATTGMRRGELLGLRWRDLDLARSRLEVRQTLVSVAYELQFSTPKTVKGRRAIALDQRTVSAIERHRTAQDEERRIAAGIYSDTDLVFAHEDGKPIHPDSLTQTFERRVRDAGVPRIRLHDVRHTYATLALASGVHPKIVSERLGHASVAFTLDVYSQAIPSMQAGAAEDFARFIDNEEPPTPPPPTWGPDISP
jgi:integrase